MNVIDTGSMTGSNEFSRNPHHFSRPIAEVRTRKMLRHGKTRAEREY